MGKWLIDFYKRIEKEYKIAFIFTFVFSLLLHIYLILNNIYSEDTVFNYYEMQNRIDLGRWALSFFCSLSSYYHLSWICGLISILFISLTIVILVNLFKIKNPVVICLIGGLISSSNFVCNTLRYIYTADGYMIAMFLATLSVYFTTIDQKKVTKYIFSGILLCLSCGIYQAYIPFALVLVTFITIFYLFEGKYKNKEILFWLLKQVLMYVIALVFYFVIWKICLRFGYIDDSNYLGILEVGKINFSMITRGFSEIFLIVKNFFFADPKALYITPFSILNIIFIILSLVIIVYSSFKNQIYKNRISFLFYLICMLAVFPLGCIWIFTSNSLSVWEYWPRMLGSLTLIYVFILVLYEKYSNKFMKNIFMILIVAIVFNNSVMTNVSYYCMDLAYERTYAEGLEMLYRIREVGNEYEEKNPDREIKELVIVGTVLYDVSYKMYDETTGELTKYANSFSYLDNLKETLIWDGLHAYLFISRNFDLKYFQRWDDDYRNSFLDKEEVKKMGVWPDKSSVAVVDNILILKISNTKE